MLGQFERQCSQPRPDYVSNLLMKMLYSLELLCQCHIFLKYG